MDDEAYLTLISSQQAATSDFISKLIQEKRTLADQLEEKTLDHDSVAFACRTAQRELQKLQEKETRMRKNRYVMVLIDGDGMIFKQPLLEAGKLGGTEAGRLLLHDLPTKLPQPPTTTGASEIHVKIFANVPKLAAVLAGAGRVQSAAEFRDFAVGFTQTREHMYFIDVGDGKEMVDSRIRAELMWHLENYNCVRVVLGVSHDNGYARVLSSIVSDSGGTGVGKVVLLEGTPTAMEVKVLPFQSIRLPKLFEAKKLKFPKQQQQQQQQQMYSPTTQKLMPAVTTTTTPSSSPQPTRTPTPTPPPSGPKNPTASPATTSTAMTRIKHLQPPPCNDHYLVGNCWRGASCIFSHTHTLSDLEVAALKMRLAPTRCSAGGKCKNPKCYRTHQCESLRYGKCVRPNCPFLESEHPPGAFVRK